MTTYTINSSGTYDCALCGHTSPDLDQARAHRAAHVAGPELLAAADAAIRYDEAIQKCAGDPGKMSSFCTAQDETLDTLYEAWITAAHAARAKLDPKGTPHGT